MLPKYKLRLATWKSTQSPWMPLWQHSAKDETCVPCILVYSFLIARQEVEKTMAWYYVMQTASYPWTMSALDKALVRDEVSCLKTDFNQLYAEGKILD